MYSKALAFFLALPKHHQRFITGTYFDATRSCACALGVLNPELQTMPKGFQEKAIDDLINDEIVEPNFLILFSMSISEARALQSVNDTTFDYRGYTPETRFTKVIEWLKERVEEEQ